MSRRISCLLMASAAVDRIEATLQTMQTLEHHRGHLFNWYDTRDGRPLDPQYVSSVDSGNLAGSLLALANACQEMMDEAVPGRAALSGIVDAALLLREATRAGEDGRRLDEALDEIGGLDVLRPLRREAAELDQSPLGDVRQLRHGHGQHIDRGASRDEDRIQAWLREWVHGVSGRTEYLEKLGAERVATP